MLSMISIRSKHQQLIILLSLLINATLYTNSIADENTTLAYYNCGDHNSNFTTGSTYSSNLRLLLTSLASATITSGFAEDSKGLEPNQVFGLALCRGDISKSQCQQCLSDAQSRLLEYCPLRRSAIDWEEKCLLHYSNRSITYYDNIPARFNGCSGEKVTDLKAFEDTLRPLMQWLADQAAYGSKKMFATGVANRSSSEKVYGLMQCTRDLSQDDCYNCLMGSLGFVEEFCWGTDGALVLGASCMTRFEPYIFYNQSFESTTSPPPPPLAAVPPPPLKLEPQSSVAGSRQGTNTPGRIVLIVIPIVTVFMCATMIMLCLWRRRRYIVLFSGKGDEDNNQSETRLFSLGLIRDATNNFSVENKLGEGGFGAVYKGVLADGLEIAVKRLAKRSKQGLVELKNEVVFMAKLQHRNLVRLLGCCLEENEKLVVYEFLPNLSLDKYLFGQSKRGELNWQTRYKIVEGIARGLLYLHEDSRLTVIHRDLKASNILLDESMSPKISDFGIAKLFDVDKSHGKASQIAGTNGYMAPEYAIHGHFSTRSDVYSFGVLILEIVTGRRITDFLGSGQAANLLSYAWNNWNKEKALDIVDSSLCELQHHQQQEVLRCIQIGLLCVQEEPNKRPNMAAVVLMLNSYSVTLSSPSIPGFFIKENTINEESIMVNNDRKTQEDKYTNSSKDITTRNVSTNFATVTDIEGR